MSNAQLLVWTIAVIALVSGVLYFAFRRRPMEGALGDTADLDPPRSVGKHPALGASYSKGPHYGRHRDAHITLTPRHLEHINILRRRDDRPPMNVAGFRTAIARQAFDTEPRAVSTTNDWVAYLIAYAALSSDHVQHRVAVDIGGIAISPDLPYNGQGGTFGGAGASSSFDPPAGDPPDTEIGKTATQGLAYGAGALAVSDVYKDVAAALAPEPASAPEPDRSAPEPAPSYSAPEPASSPPSDTSGGDTGGVGGSD